MDDDAYEQIPRWKHREEVFGARVQGFFGGLIVAMFAWAVLGPTIGLLDTLADHHPGKLLVGVIGLGVVGFVWMAIKARRPN